MIDFDKYIIVAQFKNLEKNILTYAKKMDESSLEIVIEKYLNEQLIFENSLDSDDQNNLQNTGFINMLKNAWKASRQAVNDNRQNSSVKNTYGALKLALQNFQNALNKFPAAQGNKSAQEILKSLNIFNSSLASDYTAFVKSVNQQGSGNNSDNGNGNNSDNGNGNNSGNGSGSAVY